ncbi:MAG: Fic family protein, partial [Ahrensia sp.]
GLAKNHPYVDGNKRTAFLAAVVFLRINGWAMTASEVAATQAVLSLAGGDSDQEAFAVWLRANTNPL